MIDASSVLAPPVAEWRIVGVRRAEAQPHPDLNAGPRLILVANPDWNWHARRAGLALTKTGSTAQYCVISAPPAGNRAAQSLVFTLTAEAESSRFG